MYNDYTGQENTDNEENTTVFFGLVHLSHSQEHYEDLMEQELNLNEDKTEDLYSKALNTVLLPYFPGNSEESTMLMEQSVWYASASTPTPHEGC